MFKFVVFSSVLHSVFSLPFQSRISLLAQNLLWTITSSSLFACCWNCRFGLLLFDCENIYVQNAFEVFQDEVDKVGECSPYHGANGEHCPEFVDNRFTS